MIKILNIESIYKSTNLILLIVLFRNENVETMEWKECSYCTLNLSLFETELSLTPHKESISFAHKQKSNQILHFLQKNHRMHFWSFTKTKYC